MSVKCEFDCKNRAQFAMSKYDTKGAFNNSVSVCPQHLVAGLKKTEGKIPLWVIGRIDG